jgi:hypothetical protein
VTTVSLYWPEYRLFPYERAFAISEATALLAPRGLADEGDRVTVDTPCANAARRLTYFSGFQRARKDREPTIQHLIEMETSGGSRRQSTRYSVHGLHEYKGKFNPQIARSLLNAAGLPRKAAVLDPFCGSGTTLVECAHAGLRGIGTDINPLATLIATAKVKALACDPGEVAAEASGVVRAARKARERPLVGDARCDYLRRWFEEPVLRRLEALRLQMVTRTPSVAAILLVVASNLLREFSLQEPQDLRIRRRKSPPSERDIYDVFLKEVEGLVSKVRVIQRHMDLQTPSVTAHHSDVRSFLVARPSRALRGKFHAAITSPPYAMALPYIDTQRLSLVWLRLVEPRQLQSLQAELIGSREFNGSRRGMWDRNLLENTERLPRRHAALCRRLLRLVGDKDGFRRRAVPALLYRYLVGMRDSLLAVHSLLRTGAPFFLIVGHNHSVLGGQRVDIDTPALLADLAREVGFEVEGCEGLQTYQRYGLHQKNAIDREELLSLRAT